MPPVNNTIFVRPSLRSDATVLHSAIREALNRADLKLLFDVRITESPDDFCFVVTVIGWFQETTTRHYSSVRLGPDYNIPVVEVLGDTNWKESTGFLDWIDTVINCANLLTP